MIIDALQEILYTLQRNKLRTFLTAFGVFWGIFLLILLLGLGEGLNKAAIARFQHNELGAVWVWSRKTSVPYKGMMTGRSIYFNASDVDALRRIDGLKYVATLNPVGYADGGNILVTHKQKYGSFGIFGVGEDYFNIEISQNFDQGRNINSFDQDETRKVATIGTLVADRLFNGTSPIGEYIEINNISFKVVGLFYYPDQNNQDAESVFIPLSVYIATFGRGKHDFRMLKYTPKSGHDPFDVEKKVVTMLKQRHQVAPDDRSAIRSWNSTTALKKATASNRAIQIFIWFVGFGTLAAGVVGISNIMLITVKERTAEIGVKKALGAQPLNIVFSLLFESVVITIISGYLGIVAGVGLLESINFFMKEFEIKNDYFLNPEIDFTIAISAVFILVGVGVLAGLVPAWKAVRISPVEAMKAT